MPRSTTLATSSRGWAMRVTGSSVRRRAERHGPASRELRNLDTVPRPKYHSVIGSQAVDLPIVELDGDTAIALLITVDQGIRFCEVAGAELAALLGDLGVEVVASVATMGIPIAIEVT